ncbi:hypothetical protein GCM10011415_08450 [Salipiger pallidus]|uniref:Bacteriophage phiJL001 Gp84 C-terminal domain-containing protein n=1 Tax=Salipiger pallidus TaxID=1775170 RepID=A0A8J2ZHI4_9RHOB|nr:DUF2163 domain-containing protein [Salipiger pallidus]GGG64226.1 hypothetical protein GCM10011415_08450 [Salipiger pallidus]
MGVAELHAHLATGLTTVSRCWRVTRTDGLQYGFTDHDRDLSFDGQTFRADTGLSALALQQATGLSVDNTEAMGALRDDALSEADIEAGRFDGAEVVCWLVNWHDTDQRKVLFRGTIGEIRRGDGAFHAELRGLTEALNRPVGRVYQAPCPAVLGDGTCRVDLSGPRFRYEGRLLSATDNRSFTLGPLEAFEPGWFLRGRLEVLDGAASGLALGIKRDQLRDGDRVIELWEPFGAPIIAGDTVRITAGCDKRFDTCRQKFHNGLNFQGFPDIPEEDWLMVFPSQSGSRMGGSRR